MLQRDRKVLVLLHVLLNHLPRVTLQLFVEGGYGAGLTDDHVIAGDLGAGADNAIRIKLVISASPSSDTLDRVRNAELLIVGLFTIISPVEH